MEEEDLTSNKFLLKTYTVISPFVLPTKTGLESFVRFVLQTQNLLFQASKYAIHKKILP
jgi:hypothetical protein